MEKRKVVFFIYELGAGGAARTIVNIANYIDQNMFEPIIVTLNYAGSYEKYIQDNVRIVKLPTKRLRTAIIPLRNFLKEEDPHIVFSTIPNYNTIAIISRILSRTKAKSVVREAAYLGGTLPSNMKLFLYGRLYRFAKKVVALSNGVKQNIMKRYFVPEQKIEVIYNPIDLQTIEQQAKTSNMPGEHEQLFTDHRKTIVSAGRLVPEKDQETLINAFAMVNKEIPSRLVILGEGELKSDLIALAKQLKVSKYVHFIGFQQNPYQYFHRADIFALSSTSEGFGHVLVEALATGTIVVSTDCKPGSTEILQDGKYGLISPVGDAIKMAGNLRIALSMSDEEQAKLISAGKERAQHFSAEKIVKQYEKVFLQTLGDDK